MIGKLSSPAIWGIAIACIVLLAACNNGPSLQFVTVTPINGTVFFSAGAANGVKGTRAGANSTRKSAAAVSPQDLSSASCQSMQFKANALFSNGSSVDETNSAQWSSSNTSVAFISQTGNATGFNIGTTTIGAVFNGITASPANLEVDGLNTITMNPSSATIPSTGSQSFQALGNFTLANGSPSQQDISSGFGTMWASSDSTVATVDNAGNITVKGSGTTNITATSCDFGTVGTAMLTVGPPPVTLVITPSTPAIATGTTIQFLALTHSDNSPVLNPVTWQSLSTNVATIDAASGLALGVAGGCPTSPNIMATETENGTTFTGTATLCVQAAAARFAYVASFDNPLSIYSYIVSGGALTSNAFDPINNPNGQNPYPFPTTAPGPQQVLIHPSGDFLYYIDGSCTVVTAFIDSTTGDLTLKKDQMGNAVAATTPLHNSCIGAMDPLGRFLYVQGTNTGGASALFGFSITQPTAQSGKTGSTVGTLTAISGFDLNNGYTDATLVSSDWIMVDRTGKYAYVVNTGVDPVTSVQGQGTISQYSIGSDGGLTPLSTPTQPAGNGTSNAPFFGTIDRNNNLFVANIGSASTDQTISAFTIDASTGQLTSLGPDTVVSNGSINASATINVITSPVANNLYVLDAGPGGPGQNGQVFAFSYVISGTPATISLAPIGTTTQQTGPNAFGGIAIDPTGTLLLVDDFGMNATPSTPGSVFFYTVGANGGLPSPPASVSAGVGTEFVTFYTALAGQ